MRTWSLLFLITFSAQSASAWELGKPTAALTPQESPAAADTVRNRVLEDMLSEFAQNPAATQLPYESWTLDAHRYLGFGIVAATAAQIVLGSMTWDRRKAGIDDPSTKKAHQVIGYATAGLSVAQSALGYVNFWKLKDKPSGAKKRLAHLTLSTLATAGFVTAAAIAYNSREEIEDGTAAREGKTFDDLYSNHRTIGILSGVSVLFTITVIVW